MKIIGLIFDDDRKFLFFEWKNEENFLVVVDLADEGESSFVRHKVGPEIFPSLDEPVKEKMTVKDLRVNGGLTVQTYHPYGNENTRTFSIPLDVISPKTESTLK